MEAASHCGAAPQFSAGEVALKEFDVLHDLLDLNSSASRTEIVANNAAVEEPGSSVTV